MDKSDFITKLYLDPIENIRLNKKTFKRYRLKEQGKEETDVMKSLPNLQSNSTLMGSVIMQNWNTRESIPPDIGNCINYPIIIDRSKFKKNDTILSLPDANKKIDFSKTKIRENGERLIQTTAATERIITTLPNSRYQTEFTEENHKVPLALPSENDYQTSMVCLTEQKPSTNVKKETDKKEIINFSNFNRHLYLRDNDFLYAKRVGGPLEFSLCTYQDIKQPKRLAPLITSRRNMHQSQISGNTKKKTVEYITISKNTVLHYQNGIPSVYSIQEWVENYEVYQRLMNLSLFKNFKTAKLFDLWRRFFKKTKRAYYTEKLTKKFHLTDEHLRNGIFGIRKILKEMEYTNIFETEYTGALLLNKFTELHKEKLKEVDQKIENYRSRVKAELVTACNQSYLAYKSLKKITLDDNISTSEAGKDGKKTDGPNIQNFLKDAIPYAQDATRKTHYKKLLRFIRVIDYLFNETKYKVIQFSLEKLDIKFNRLYECYLNKWVDPPLVITMILCMKGKIFYNPSIELMREFIFDNFIQEKLYTVIYKKSFIDPQEFPNYMTVFEEVFESSVDQNANLNSRIMESQEIIKIFNSIKNSFDQCKQSLIAFSDTLKPILENFNEFNNINFKELETNSTPEQLKELLDKFLKEAVVIRNLRQIVNVGIFEFHLDYLIDMVQESPKIWLNKIRTVIPTVFVSKLNYSIKKLGNYLRNLSVNPTDVESFIKLKKAVEVCLKDRKQTEDESNEILDLSTIVTNDKEIKLQEYDSKLIIELKDLSVKYERKLDSMSYFIDNNIQKFRLDLKTDIQKFDNEIKGMITELNNDTLNKYAEDTFAALDFLEENSIKISKAIHMREKYRTLEDDLEIDQSLRSNFENLENLECDYNLKVDMWNSVKEFQDTSRHWNDEQLMSVKIDEMKSNIKKWKDLCQVALVDLDFPNVPTELLQRVKVYEQLVPILTAIQNPNILNEANLLNSLLDILHIDNKLEDPMYTVQKILDIQGIFEKLDDIIELNTRANEEKKLKDNMKTLSEGFYSRKLPIKINFNKKDFDKEFEFTEENIDNINKMYLNKYCAIILKQLQKTEYDLQRYYNFLKLYSLYQEYIFKSEGIMENGEFSKEMPVEYKKLLSENLKKNLFKHLKDNPIVSRFLDNAYEKVINLINNIIQNFEQNYKAITTYLDKKRKEFPKYYLLSDEELAQIHIDKDSVDIKTKLLLKLFPWIKTINIGTDIDEYLTMTTNDDELINLKFTKTSRSMKDCIDVIETGLYRKLKEMFKKFKKEYEESVKSRSANKPKNVLQSTLENKDNMAQGIFNCMYYFMIDSIERALAIEDQAFDKLFDLYHEIKDDRLESYIAKLKDKNTPTLMRRILVNLISLENYCKGIIENLIREDVTSVSDYNYMRIIQTKLENDTYVLHMLTFTIEYGFEYVGIENNFVMIPESERLYLSFANCINLRKSFMIYGISDSGKKEIMRTFANLCGKRINYICGTNEYDDKSFNNTLLGSLKNGAWICIDRSEAIKREALDLLCNRIMEVYRIIRENAEDEVFIEGTDKYQVNIKQMNIFMIRNISNLVQCQFDANCLPIMARSYFRHIAFPVIDYKQYLTLSLMNLGINNAEMYAKKVLYIINYYTKRIICTRKKNITFRFVYSIIAFLVRNIENIEKENINELLRNATFKAFYPITTLTESEELNRLLNVVFNMKDYANENNSQNDTEEDSTLKKAIIEELNSQKINSSLFEQKITNLISALKCHNSFVLLGPSLSGKTRIISLISEIFSNLNFMDSEKYSRFLSVRMFPKAQTPYAIFAENKIESAYQLNNNFFHNMLSLFNCENKEILEKLNLHYNSHMRLCSDVYLADSNKRISSPTKISATRTLEAKEDEEEEDRNEYHPQIQDMIDNANIKAIIFDGNIDQSWIEYANIIYSDLNLITFANGDHSVLNSNWKFFYETMDVRNASPSFLTRQFLVGFDYSHFNYECILYSWIESNEKVSANTELKNYIRGLFENFFPKIYDFILNNKFKNLIFSENYTMTILIKIFDAVFPLFNFEDKKIGRKNFNVIPKIELIKKSTLSIFIFACAWTMMFLSNFVIKTKIEKLISDIFKADDLKGPIFDYFIDDNSHDFEQWSTLLNSDAFALKCKIAKNEIFYYDNIFVHSNDTIAYSWLLRKFIERNFSVFYTGKENSGKSFLVNSTLDSLFKDEMKIKKIKFLISHNSTRNDIESYLIKNLDVITRDISGDKFGKKVVLYIDDLNMNIKRDQYNISEVFEYVRELSSQKCMYDSKTNSFAYLDKFNVFACGNISAYPLDSQFSRVMSHFILVTQLFAEDAFVNVFKPTLEMHLRNYIPNTSSITATQYIQSSLKLNSLLNEHIANEPWKLHLQFSIRDVMRVVQSFHLFAFKGGSDYPEYLKKLFFYESSRIYEDRMNSRKDIEVFKEKICEAYSSVFKQDKVTVNDIFANFDKENTYIFARNYIDEENNKEYAYYTEKKALIEYIRNKVDFFYSQKKINDRNLIKVTEDNIDSIIKLLRIMENEKANMMLIGKENNGKNALIHFAAFIAGYEVRDIDPTYANKSKEVFINEVINPVLVDVTYKNKKIILFSESKNIECDFILDTLNKLIDSREILNNFAFMNDEEYGKISYEDATNRLIRNLSIAIDVKAKSENYKKIFLYYPYIAKNCACVYLHSMKESGLKNYFYECIKEINFNAEKEKIIFAFYNIFTFAKELYRENSKKINIDMKITQKSFCTACEFYAQKYSKYKELILSNHAKYIDAIEMISKSENIVQVTKDEIASILPGKSDLEKQIEEIKTEIGKKVLERSNWKSKKIEEEKAISSLEKDKVEKEELFDNIITPFKEALQKSLNGVNRISSGDITEIKNTWDSLNFGKLILAKIFECLGDNNSDWDYIKRTLDIKIIKNFANVNAIKLPQNLLDITNEITSNAEFSNGDKYQKPFKTCGVLCDYFLQCKNYFDEVNSQKALLDEIEDIKQKIKTRNDTIKQYNKNISQIEKDSAELEKNISEIEKKKANVLTLLEKKNAIVNTFTEFIETSKDKTAIWTKKKTLLDDIIANFDFYLMLLSAFICYAGPLSHIYREKLKMYMFSLSEDIYSKSIPMIPIYQIATSFLDITGRDNEFALSLSPFNEFYKENFVIMYLHMQKVPFIIDNNRIAKEVISQFLEFKNQKGIVSTVYNSQEMIDKIESSMKNGSICFVEQCEDEIADLLKNVLIGANLSDDKRKIYEFANRKVEKNEKFKLLLLKNKLNSQIKPKIFANTIVVNFNATNDVVKEKIFNGICNEQNAKCYSSYVKTSNDIAKDEFRVLEIENKIHNYINQFDLSGAIDKIEKNENLLERYKIEIQTHNSMLTTIDANKKKVFAFKQELQRFNTIANDAANLYKWYKKFFSFDNIYMFTLNVFCEQIREFYKFHFGIFSKIMLEMKKGQKAKKVELPNEDEDNDDAENGSDIEEEKKSEVTPEIISMQKAASLIPTYTKDNLFQLIISIYKQYNSLYSQEIKDHILLITLFFCLKEKEEIPSNYKTLIMLVNSIYFNNNIDTETYNEKSPFNSISSQQWNALKQINDMGSYVFSIVIDHMENHIIEWDEYLNEDLNANDGMEYHYTKNFIIFSEEVESSLNPFLKFLFFSILKPNKGKLLIDCTIKNILGNRYEEVQMKSFNSFKSEFDVDISKSRKPILLIENDNEDLNMQIKDYYLPLLKSKEKSNSANAQNENQKSEFSEIMFKEIIPSKSELTVSEQEIIHTAMKNGGVIVLRKSHILKDSLMKLCDEIRDSNTQLNSNFKLVLIAKRENILQNFIYKNCNFVNRKSEVNEDIKHALIDEIRLIPDDLFMRFMNKKCSYTIYMRKAFLYTLITHCVLTKISQMKNCIIRIPIEFRRKDLIAALNFIYSFISATPDDKVDKFANVDNDIGFTYSSLISIMIDAFVDSKLIFAYDVQRVNKIISKFFDEENMLNAKYLFNYNNEFVIENDFDNSIEQIYIDDIVRKFEDIPSENYHSLIYGLSQQIANHEIELSLRSFYDTITISIDGKGFKSQTANKYKTSLISQVLNRIKLGLPDALNASEGYPLLFKVNKLNDYINPLDTCLLAEMNSYNAYISQIQNDINNLNLALKREMVLNEEFSNIIDSLSLMKLPRKWALNANDEGMNIDKWLKMIKERFDVITQWIKEGSLKCYDMNKLINKNLFLGILPMYFIRKYNDDKTSPEKVHLKFEFIRCNDEKEVNDKVLEKINKRNEAKGYCKEFLMIKGLVMKNAIFDDKLIVREFLNYEETEEEHICPIAMVGFCIDEIEEEEEENNNNKGESEEEEEEDEDEDEVKKEDTTKVIKQEEVEENKDKHEEAKEEEVKEEEPKQNEEVKQNEEEHKEEEEEDEDIEDENIITVPFVDREFANSNKYMMKQPYGYFEIRIPHESKEEYYTSRNIRIFPSN